MHVGTPPPLLHCLNLAAFQSSSATFSFISASVWSPLYRRQCRPAHRDIPDLAQLCFYSCVVTTFGQVSAVSQPKVDRYYDDSEDDYADYNVHPELRHRRDVSGWLGPWRSAEGRSRRIYRSSPVNRRVGVNDEEVFNRRDCNQSHNLHAWTSAHDHGSETMARTRLAPRPSLERGNPGGVFPVCISKLGEHGWPERSHLSTPLLEHIYANDFSMRPVPTAASKMCEDDG